MGSAAPTGSDLTGAGAAAAATGTARGPGPRQRLRPAAVAEQHAAATVAAERAKKLLNPLLDPEAYNRGRRRYRAANKALLSWSSAQLALWCTVFVLVIAGVPIGLWAFQRRRRRDLPDPVA